MPHLLHLASSINATVTMQTDLLEENHLQTSPYNETQPLKLTHILHQTFPASQPDLTSQHGLPAQPIWSNQHDPSPSIAPPTTNNSHAINTFNTRDIPTFIPQFQFSSLGTIRQHHHSTSFQSNSSRDDFLLEACDLQHTYQPHMMVILDTRIQAENYTMIIRELGYAGHVVAHSLGQTGGIWVMWAETTIHATTLLLTPRSHQVWSLLESISSTVHDGWLVVGDFNAILHPHEKFGGRKFCPYKAKPFKDCMHYDARPRTAWRYHVHLIAETMGFQDVTVMEDLHESG
ncbi:hypothetical protein LguiB_013618 [Lonicera macranthoides]